MKTHHCAVDDTTIAFEGSCNWCNEKEWVTLSDDEIMDCLEEVYRKDVNYDSFARAIEAKLKEKNT